MCFFVLLMAKLAKVKRVLWRFCEYSQVFRSFSQFLQVPIAVRDDIGQELTRLSKMDRFILAIIPQWVYSLWQRLTTH